MLSLRTVEILRAYFAADLNAAEAAARIGLSAERVRQVVRAIQEERRCTRIELARIVEPPEPPRRRRALMPEGQEALWQG